MIINAILPKPLSLDNDMADVGIFNYSHTESLRPPRLPTDFHRTFRNYDSEASSTLPLRPSLFIALFER